MAIGSEYYNIIYTSGTTTSSWLYGGSGSYLTNHGNCIKVDKGAPDKAQFVIFYAIENKDPMIFCKDQKELDREMKKLMKREEVDKASIRIFALTGGVKKI